jgi:hypothetical protein
MFSTGPVHVSGELPDLINHLEVAYREHTKLHASIAVEGYAFLKWAKQYLTENRPSEVFPVDRNYGFVLTNGVRLKLCPDVTSEAGPGSMASKDSSVSIISTR